MQLVWVDAFRDCDIHCHTLIGLINNRRQIIGHKLLFPWKLNHQCAIVGHEAHQSFGINIVGQLIGLFELPHRVVSLALLWLVSFWPRDGQQVILKLN